ncbi:hypothetical protein CHS0354_042865 [Potamilus streckersoni]|uniref:Uncharacterized protein n=1 Tax=Potamilus streckersoni TaxID=2493646 RepID=A0AAE0W814_9BIVA|nr:hypothetical protein CHS0354_042865 [Potamilus streckersoni]
MDAKLKIGSLAEESNFQKSDDLPSDNQTEKSLESAVTIETDDPYALPELKDMGVAWKGKNLSHTLYF